MKRISICIFAVIILLFNPISQTGAVKKDLVKEIVQTKFEVYQESQFTLPSKVKVKLRTGKIEIASIRWDKYSNIAKTLGKHTFTGVITKYGEKEKFTVTVIGKNVTNYRDFFIGDKLYIGASVKLPENVSVSYSNFTSGTENLTWYPSEFCDVVDNKLIPKKPGSFQLKFSVNNMKGFHYKDIYVVERITFENKELENAIIEQCGLSEIINENIKEVTRLTIDTKKIKSLKDIEKLTYIETIELNMNYNEEHTSTDLPTNWAISDLNKLASLKTVVLATSDKKIVEEALKLKVPELNLSFESPEDYIVDLHELKNSTFKIFTFQGAIQDWTALKEVGSRMKVSWNSYISENLDEVGKYNDMQIKNMILEKCNIEGLATPEFPRWRKTLTTYLTYNADKTISVIEAKGEVNIETYDKNYKSIGKNAIKYELPLFGGYYSGREYNFIAFGQRNDEQNDKKEVIRIVRYDKSFKRIDSVSITGGESYTIVPFDAACGRMAEQGSTLVFHTSRTRYKTEDGLNHQSQLTVIVDTAAMKVTNSLGKFQNNHVSHSFDQYVLFDGEQQVLLDHGDAYPRSIVLSKKTTNKYSTVDVFKIPGKTGANCTGVSIGGFEASTGNYLVAMNSIDHSLVKEYTSYEMVGLTLDQRDPIICVVPKNFTSSEVVKQITLSKYVGSNKIASIPQLVKINEDKFMVIWQEFQANNYGIGDLKYIFIDGNGNVLSEIQSKKDFVLSSNKPMAIDHAVVWSTSENGTRVFYSISLD